jgi:voltage-gated potassium channel
MENNSPGKGGNWKEKTYRIIFESDTFYGKLFDMILLVLILLSITVVMLESISLVRSRYYGIIYNTEWSFTIIFTIEYILRIISSPNPRKYILSFLGIVDFLAILPTYLGLILPGVQPLIVIRAIRLLRIYRIFKLYHFLREGNLLLLALRRSLPKILIFMLFILITVILLGSIIYVVESGQNGFDSIPLSIYWAIITITTVGYGDIVPMTDVGKFIAAFIMLLGYSIIAIPTGIVSVEIARTFSRKQDIQRICNLCNETNHDPDSNFCRICGNRLMEI